jgi:hypothetical protein
LAGEALAAWQDIAGCSMVYLVDLSQTESDANHAHSDHLNTSPVLGTLPTDLLLCHSISEMIPLIFRMYSIESSLYKNVNYFLRCFPMVIVGKFMNELKGILRYIYLLQSSIECCAHHQPVSEGVVVYRGIQSQGTQLATLYESMVGEVIVWPGFTSTSTNRDLVISRFLKDENSLLFEIALHTGAVAADIQDYSAYRSESEILIAASSGFMVDEVDWIDVQSRSRTVKIAHVRLSYCMSWYDFNIDDLPAPVFV